MTLDDHGHKPVKPGYVRVYDDQFERNYTDYTEEQMAEMAKDPFLTILREEIRKEINKDIIEKLRKAKNYGNIDDNRK